jgi:UDP-N-acetylmuramate dehydrogenase
MSRKSTSPIFPKKMKIQENVSLKEYTTFKIGGPAKFFCIVKNEDDLIEAFNFSKKNKLPTFVLGGGSNLLVADNGYQGLIIKVEMMGMIHAEDGDVIRVTAMAGEGWDDFVEKMVERGYYGLENLSGIPGTVGASPVQNIGAYGSEVKDTIESVYVLDMQKDEYKTFTNSECRFDYRNSLFKEESGRYIVLSVTFKLNKKGKLNFNYKDIQDALLAKRIKDPTLKQMRNIILDIRSRKLPDLKSYGTAGSFFKNVIVSSTKAKELLEKYPEMIVHAVNNKKVKIPLAWILDHVCGFRGVKKGNVGTYQNQALVLVNFGNATAKEIIDLAQKMVDRVYEETGIEIEPEVEYLN